MQAHFIVLQLFSKFFCMIPLFFMMVERVLDGITILAATMLFFIKGFAFKKRQFFFFKWLKRLILFSHLPFLDLKLRQQNTRYFNH